MTSRSFDTNSRVFWNVVKVVFHPALICCSLQGLYMTVVHSVCAHTFLSLCLSFLSYWNPFYRRILPRVSAGLEGVNPSLGGSLLRQQPIWQSIASHSPSSLQSANHRAGDDGQPRRSPSLSPSLLSASSSRNGHFLFDYWKSVCSCLVSILRFGSSSRLFAFTPTD